MICPHRDHLATGAPCLKHDAGNVRDLISRGTEKLLMEYIITGTADANQPNMHHDCWTIPHLPSHVIFNNVSNGACP